jgi:hypothetical protein
VLPISGVTAHEYSPFCRFSGGFKDAFAKVDFQMQTDGNLVVDSTGAGSRPLWSSGTAGQTPCVLAVQSDGNVVLYRRVSGGLRAVWATNSSH